MIVLEAAPDFLFTTKSLGHLQEKNGGKIYQNILNWNKGTGYQIGSCNNYRKFFLPQNLSYPKTQSRPYSKHYETKTQKRACILNAMD